MKTIHEINRRLFVLNKEAEQIDAYNAAASRIEEEIRVVKQNLQPLQNKKIELERQLSELKEGSVISVLYSILNTKKEKIKYLEDDIYELDSQLTTLQVELKKMLLELTNIQYCIHESVQSEQEFDLLLQKKISVIKLNSRKQFEEVKILENKIKLKELDIGFHEKIREQNQGLEILIRKMIEHHYDAGHFTLTPIVGGGYYTNSIPRIRKEFKVLLDDFEKLVDDYKESTSSLFPTRKFKLYHVYITFETILKDRYTAKLFVDNVFNLSVKTIMRPLITELATVSCILQKEASKIDAIIAAEKQDLHTGEKELKDFVLHVTR